MAIVLQLVGFWNQEKFPIHGINGQVQQDDIISITNVDTYSIDTDSVFDRVAEDYFGQNYTDTRLNQCYKTSLGIKHSDEPFSIKAGSNYILGKGSWLHAQSYVNNVEWATNFSITDFRNCWKVNQKDAVKITVADKSIDCGVWQVNPRDSVPFDTTIDSIIFTLDKPDTDLPEYLNSFAFSEATFSAYDSDSRLVVDLDSDSVTWQDVQVEPTTVTFNNVHLQGTISNGTRQPRPVSVMLSANFNLYKIFASATAKARIYDHASNAYDSIIQSNNRYYYLYYGNNTSTDCLGFTSSQAEYVEEHVTQPSTDLSSNDLLNSTRCPDVSVYKPSPTSTLDGWNIPSSSEWSGEFEQDNYIFINIYKVTPIWFDRDASYLVVNTNSSNKSFSDNTYANNLFLEGSSYFSTNTKISKGTLRIPKHSGPRTIHYLSNQTSRLVKITYSSTETYLKSILFNNVSLFDKTPEQLAELQNSYLQVNINSSSSPTSTLSGGVSLLSAYPVAVKFNFKDTTNTIQVYFKLKFSTTSSSNTDLTWTLDKDYEIPLILKSTTASVSIGDGKTLLGGSYYYSFGSNTYFAPNNRKLAFNAIFDEVEDNVLFVDQSPTNSPTYKLDAWNKAYPTKYFFRYKSNSYEEKTLRVGIVDNIFVPTFNWTPLSLGRYKFDTITIDSAANYTTYRLHLSTSISNDNKISYKLMLAYKTGTTESYSEDYEYDILSPLVLVKMTSAGGNGGGPNTSAHKGGGGGGSGAGVYAILDLTYTSSSKGCYIYICLGKRPNEVYYYGLSSYISFEDPSFKLIDNRYTLQIPSSDFVKLTVGEDGENWISDENYNRGGSGGTADTDSSVDSSLCSYCHILQLINGQSGGNGESNSGGTGTYDHDATAGAHMARNVNCIKNRRLLSYSYSNFTQSFNYSGAAVSVYDVSNPYDTFSAGGGGAASIFGSAVRRVAYDDPSDIPAGTGGGGGFAYQRGNPKYSGPNIPGEAFAEIYYLPDSN